MHRSEPEAGSDILSLLGFAAIICGGAIVGIRSLIEALSSDGNPRMIQGLGRSGRVGLGTVAMGLLMAIFGSVGESILREVSSSHYGSELSTSILSAVARIGGVLLLCGFLILVLGQTGRRSMLLGWVDRKGWGKIGCGWVNKLGLAFVAIGFLTSVAGLEETLAILTVAGGAIILVGLIFHLTEAGTP